MRLPALPRLAATALAVLVAVEAGAPTTVAAGQVPPGFETLVASPDMQQGIAAVRRRDFRTAVPLFRAAANRGNPLAQLILARFYFEGDGVPRNTVAALQMIKLIIRRNQEPTRSAAADLAFQISKSLRNSPNPNDRDLSLVAAMLPLAANPYVQNWHPAPSNGFLEGWIMHGLMSPSEE